MPATRRTTPISRRSRDDGSEIPIRAQLRRAEARHDAVLRVALDCIITIDSQGCILEFNPAAEHTFGYTREEILGAALVMTIVPPSLRAAHSEGFARCLATGVGPFLGSRVEIHGMRKDGSEFPIELTITPVELEGETIFTAYLRDLTAIRERERELNARANYEALQNKIGAAVRTLRDPDRIQQASAQALGEMLHVDRCYFSFYDMAADTRWIGQDFRREGLPSLAGVYQISNFQVNPEDYHPNGKTLSISDVTTVHFSGPMREAMDRLRVRSVLAVPIYDAGRLAATLTVAMADAPREWTAAEIQLIEAVAVQTRTAVEEARAQQRERRIAAALQAALQPIAPDTIPGLEIAPFIKPALEESSVGGDFYDVFALNGGCYALVIGDVSGKGLAAAAQLATVRNMLRTVLYQEAPLSVSITDLNAILTNHDLLTGYVTVFCSLYDAANGALTYVSCGHEPGLLRRADGALETLDPCGPPLGVAEQARYTSRTVTLAQHDTLLLYTDGLSEAGVTRLDLLGTTGLIRILTALPADLALADAAQRIVAGAADFAHGVFRDDICVLMARR